MCGCGDRTAKILRRSARQRRVVAIVPQQTQGPYWSRIEKGARAAARELDVVIRWEGPLTPTEAVAQKVIVQKLVAVGVDGIAIAPIDPAIVMPAMEQATGANLPIVVFHARLDGATPICTIVPDEKQIGVEAAQKMYQIFGGWRAKLLTLSGPSSLASNARADSFADWMSKASMDVIGNESCDDDAASGARTAASVLRDFVKNDALQIDGIFATDEQTTEQVGRAVRALRREGLARKAVIVGYGTSPVLIDLLRSGTIRALLVPQPERMGELIIRNLVRYLDGEKVKPTIDPGIDILQ